jgi:hypothetical protein
MASRTRSQVLRAAEEAAREELGDLIMRLEGAGERVAVAEDTYRQAVVDRDRLVYEANRAGLTLELIGQIAGIQGGQPNVTRAKLRHKRRMQARARARVQGGGS